MILRDFVRACVGRQRSGISVTPANPARRTALFGLAISSVALAAVTCGAASAAPPATTYRALAAATQHPVGTTTITFVDHSRSTPAWDGKPARHERVLVTSIYYPAATGKTGSVTQAAAPNRKAGPYPLIVFAHGLGANPTDYAGLLEHWATAGFVVAAPAFPLTNASVAGGQDEADVVNQPKDMSFVITSMLTRSKAKSGLLHGLVNPKQVGAAGHSNGAVTTSALASNSCCQDSRVHAAIVMAGSAGSWPGKVDVKKAPPLLIIHGTADPLMPYNSGVALYNRALGPKALLSLVGGNHGDAAGASTVSRPYVFAATVDFFNAELRGSSAARSHLSKDQAKGIAVMHLALKPGSRATIPIKKAPVRHLKATVTPDTGLTNGQNVTVAWSGYTPGQTVNILQCAGAPGDKSTAGKVGDCSFKHALLLQPDPKGSGSLPFTIVTGTVGSSTCDATHVCSLVVNDGGSSDPASSVTLKLTFAK